MIQISEKDAVIIVASLKNFISMGESLPKENVSTRILDRLRRIPSLIIKLNSKLQDNDKSRSR